MHKAAVTALALTVSSLLSLSQPAAALEPDFTVDAFGCAQPEPCIVAGAETDSAATIAARAKVGSGPAVGFVADRRLKTDVKELGILQSGIRIYSFRFLWEDTVRVGVIAQDLLTSHDTAPAVQTLANGVLGVDYAAFGMRLATFDQWTQHGASALKADYVPEPRRFAKTEEAARLFNKRPLQSASAAE